jgi:UDP-N-acetylmuramate dehydrogenase
VTRRLVGALGERARAGEPLKRRATLRIGGPARIWAEPNTLDELRLVLSEARQADLPVHIAGLGSNSLFPDAGIDGVVIRLAGELAAWEISAAEDQARVWVGAGAINAHLVRAMLGAGLVGAEFLVLIPGTFGGAVAMNAGTKEQEVASILKRAELLIPDGRGGYTLELLDAADLHLSYRHAELPEGAIVVRGELALVAGDTAVADEVVRADKERRNKTQPYRLASAGSTFANPPGHFAGQLIERAGLKGARIGGAQISELHANFFINDADATAADLLGLMARARVEVRHLFGVELTPEVRFAGFDGWAELNALERAMEPQSKRSEG